MFLRQKAEHVILQLKILLWLLAVFRTKFNPVVERTGLTGPIICYLALAFRTPTPAKSSREQDAVLGTVRDP